MPYLLLLRAHWKLAALGLLLLALAVQTIRLERAERRADRAIVERNEARQALKDADEAARKQIEQTERIIERNRERDRQADTRARRIETAPLPGNCRTPVEIMLEPSL